MAPGGRDKKLCDCFASTLRKEREGRRWEVMSECYIWKPDPSASGRFYDLSRQHHCLETKSSNTRPLGDNSHSSHNSFGKTINWWGRVGKKGTSLRACLESICLERQEGSDRDPRQAEKQTESQDISGLRKMCLWSQYCDCCVGFKLVQTFKLKKKILSWLCTSFDS